MKKHILLLVCFSIAIISCNNEKPSIVKLPEKSKTIDGSIVLADSLIYGIATHANANADSSEIAEFNSFLQGELINYIFNQLYSGKLKAYDFFSEKELSINEINKLEKAEGFKRSKVGKVQFEEQWIVDKNGALIKRVNSMTFGVEHYSKQGTFLNYNALFKVKFDITSQ